MLEVQGYLEEGKNAVVLEKFSVSSWSIPKLSLILPIPVTAAMTLLI